MNKASITISRTTSSIEEEDYIGLAIRDESSRVRLVRLQISLSDFATALTGLAEVRCNAEYSGLENVGKNREMQRLVFPMPEGASYRCQDTARVEADKYVPDGWAADKHFGSQTSFFTGDDGKQWARTTAHRYVDVNGDDNEY